MGCFDFLSSGIAVADIRDDSMQGCAGGNVYRPVFVDRSDELEDFDPRVPLRPDTQGSLPPFGEDDQNITPSRDGSISDEPRGSI